MAYTTIDNPELFFQIKLYTGNGSTQSITLDGDENMQPDFVWVKDRGRSGYNHVLNDSVRGVTKYIRSNLSNAEATISDAITSFDSDGFTLGSDSSNGEHNVSSQTYVSWNWKAGGTAPAITYSVKVVSDSGNKYRFDDFGTSAVTLDLQEGGTYTFDQSDSSNSGHPLRFYTASDKSGGEYTTGVTTTGTAGSSGAKTVITVAASAPTLYYQCSNHAGMGGQANTNSTFGSSNFSGSIQSTVSANTTAGFSIVSYTGNSTSGTTVGHGLGSSPVWIIIKARDRGDSWVVGHQGIGGFNKFLYLNTNDTVFTLSDRFNNTAPSSSVFTLGNATDCNYTDKFIAYCFAEKKGYSKFGSYTGNGNADGTFIYTGFKPAFIIQKRSDSTGRWVLWDNKRNTSNVSSSILTPNANSSENTGFWYIDILSNGFKFRLTDSEANASGGTYIYMAFAESPFVNSNGVPTNAR